MLIHLLLIVISEAYITLPIKSLKTKSIRNNSLAASSVYNYENFQYYVLAEIGNPPQNVSLFLSLIPS